jgi:glycosyltransferase involved in cell wall biosynthesis
MHSPKISVIMPVFNAEAYLGSAIDSILNQTYNNFEFIIINDGSTDKSERIISSYSDHRIIRLSNAVNKGLVYSLNYGIDHAKGDLIARMDADDVALIDRLKIQSAFLTSNPEYGMCGTFYQVVDNDGKEMHEVDLPETDKDLRTFLNFGNCFCHSTVMFRSELAKKYRYEEKYFLIEDYKLWYSFSKISRVSNLPVCTLQYRIHNSNISAKKKDQMHRMLLDMNEIILRDLGIHFTEEELMLHTNFLVFNYEHFKSNGSMKELESWLLKVYGVVKNESRFNSRIVAKMFLRRWFVICFRTKNYKKLIFSALLPRFKFRYIQHFSEKLRDSYFKRNLGIDY